MEILVMGATSGIGRLTAEAAAARGHKVRAMGRSADRLPNDLPGLIPFSGDALDPDDVARAVDGVDAVVQSLGIKESLAMLWQEVTLFSRATELLLPAMKAAGVARLVAITGFGAGNSKRAMSAPERLGHGFLLGKPYADKDRQEKLLMASDLDWTIVRPTILTNRPASGRYGARTDPATWRNGLIARADVANFVVETLETGAYLREAVVISR